MCQILGEGLEKGKEQDRYKPGVREPVILLGENPYRVTE